MNAKLYMWVMIAVLGVVIATTAQAGPVCGVVTNKHVVVNTNVGHVTYAAPTSYAPLYHHQNFIPVVQQVQVVPDFFYSSASYARDEALLEALKIIRENRQERASNVVEKRSKSVDDSFDGLLDGIPDIAVGNKVVSKGSQGAVSELLQAKCVRCHNGTTTKGGLDISDLGSLSKETKVAMYEEVAAGTMPPSGSLNKEQKRLVREWALGNKE